MFIDIEAQPKYDNVNPGTITIEGWAMECWDYQIEQTNPSRSFISNRSELPQITGKQLLRRLYELSPRNNYPWSQQRDEEVMEQFARLKKLLLPERLD